MLTKKIAIALTLSAGVALAVTGVAAAEPANTLGCLHMSKQVSTALDANQSSPNYQSARSELYAGKQFCLSGLYSDGMSRYANALKLLGVPSSVASN